MLTSANPKFFKKVSGATSRLIDSLGNFDETDHEVCKEFALSHFSNSRFLSSDSHKIERRIEGMCEKFVIQSDPENAKILDSLKGQFLENSISESNTARSNLHYDLLHLILELSRDPVNRQYTPPAAKVKVEEEKFDWTSHLLDGENLPYPSQWAYPETPFDSEEEDDQVQNELATDDKKKLVCSETIKYSQPVSLEIQSRLVLPYWKHRDSARDTIRISSDYEVINIPVNSDLAEINIIREVIWVLAGCQDLYLFPIVEGKHTVREIIPCTHSTSKSLHSALRIVARYADIVRKIDNFIFTHSLTECQTYQAFGETLLSYFKKFEQFLKMQESIIVIQEDTYLLSDVLKELAPKFEELDIICAMFANSIDVDNKNDSNCVKACRLLGVLYHVILDETSKDVMKISPFKNFLIKIWVDTLRPYFEILEQWMTSGVLIDGYREFILQRSDSCPDIKSESFWSTAFSLTNEECLSQLPWLRPVLNDVVVCGKSVELLKSLGKPTKGCENSCLFDDFVKILFKFSEMVPENREVVSTQNQGQLENSCNLMLRLNFESLLANNMIHVEDREFEFEGDTSLIDLIHKSISGLVIRKLERMNEILVNVFMVEYDLISLFQCFHKFHLMEWGDVMYDFATSIFEKISGETYWMDVMSLRASLQEAIYDRDPDSDYSFVAVGLSRNNRLKLGYIHATDVVELIIDVNWPLNIVITSETKAIYNTLFSSILQVKRALFCLETLRFDALWRNCGPQKKSVIHRISLLRFSLLSLISQWHNFVMTSVIASEKSVFMERLKSVQNVDDVIIAHEKFLQRVTMLCLLKEEKQSEKLIQGTLRKIFDLAISVHSSWKRIDSVTDQHVKKLESNFKECSDFLGVILLNLVSRGSVPLSLEALAFCLMT